MITLLRHGSELLLPMLARATIQGALLAMAVAAVLLLLGRHLSSRTRCWLWGIVLLRLAMLITIPVPWNPIVLPSPHRAAPVIAADPTSFQSLQWIVQIGPAPEAGQAPPVPHRASASAPQWPLLIMAAWISVAAGLITAVAWSYRRFVRQICNGRILDDPEFLALIDQCASDMRVRRAPPVIESPRVHGPALVRMLRPFIALPPGLFQRLSPAQRRHVILHELAHLKRADMLVDAAIVLVACIHWFNPMAWLAVRRFRAEREPLRDAMVLRVCRGEHHEYGQTLFHLAETICARSPLSGALGMLGRNHDLQRRLAMLTGKRRSQLSSLFGIAIVAALALPAFTRSPGSAVPLHHGTPGSDDTQCRSRSEGAIAARLRCSRPAGGLRFQHRRSPTPKGQA